MLDGLSVQAVMPVGDLRLGLGGGKRAEGEQDERPGENARESGPEPGD